MCSFLHLLVFPYQAFSENHNISAINGGSLPAIDIFSLALNYLSEKMLKFITGKLRIVSIRPSNTLWVLTVPAIWKPGARQFMRKAAYKVLIIPHLFYIYVHAKYIIIHYCLYVCVFVYSHMHVCALNPHSPIHVELNNNSPSQTSHLQTADHTSVES